MSGRDDIGDLESSLSCWISEHVGEKSFMTNEVNQLPSSPQKESSDHGEDPTIDNRLPPEKEVNIMTQGDLDRLKESCIFPVRDLGQAPRGR